MSNQSVSALHNISFRHYKCAIFGKNESYEKGIRVARPDAIKLKCFKSCFVSEKARGRYFVVVAERCLCGKTSPCRRLDMKDKQ